MARFKVTFEINAPFLEYDNMLGTNCYRIVNEIIERMHFHYNYTEPANKEDKFMDDIRIKFESLEDINGYRIGTE